MVCAGFLWVGAGGKLPGLQEHTRQKKSGIRSWGRRRLERHARWAGPRGAVVGHIVGRLRGREQDLG